jgi:hypothetical protein
MQQQQQQDTTPPPQQPVVEGTMAVSMGHITPLVVVGL